jgi:hypothetical protein
MLVSVKRAILLLAAHHVLKAGYTYRRPIDALNIELTFCLLAKQGKTCAYLLQGQIRPREHLLFLVVYVQCWWNENVQSLFWPSHMFRHQPILWSLRRGLWFSWFVSTVLFYIIGLRLAEGLNYKCFEYVKSTNDWVKLCSQTSLKNVRLKHYGKEALHHTTMMDPPDWL